MRVKRVLLYTVVTLCVAEAVLMLVSWLLSASMTDGVRSLLSSEGVRWFLGSFSSMLAKPWLVWLLLLAMGAGCVWKSGLLRVHLKDYRQRVAFRFVVALLLFFAAAIVCLTAIPHAVLLSATGHLFPSAFSHALVPLLAFAAVLSSASFGLMSGRYHGMSDVIDSFCFGIAKAAPLFVLYLMFLQFYESLRFVFL